MSVRSVQPPGALAASAAAGLPRPEPEQTGTPQGLSVTSHSLTLRTRLFTLDYTWRNVQLNPPTSSSLGPASGDPPSLAGQQLSPADQMRRRLDLASLLDPASPPRPGPPARESALGPLAASPSRACSAYQRVQGEGPWGGRESI